MIGCLALFQGCFDSGSGGSANVANSKKSTDEGIQPTDAERAQPNAAATTAANNSDTNKLAAANANQHQPGQPQSNDPKSTGANQNKDDSKDGNSQAGESETKKKQGPPEKKYLDAQLHKNTTLLVLAYQPDIRADYLISTVRTVIDDEQYKVAKKLARQYDDQYKRVLNERAAILEVATDDKDVEGPLLELRKQVADLNATIRMRIIREILTREQRKKVVALNKLR